MSEFNHIARIRVGGFKSIREINIELRALNVLIGANGAGKSNFLSIFRLLNSLTAQRLQEFVGKEGGASALLHYGPKRTPRLTIELEFDTEDGRNSYGAELVYISPDTLFFAEEEVVYHPHGQDPRQYRLEGGGRETQLPERMNSSSPGAKTARYIKWRLDRWRSYHFHDTSPEAAVKQQADLDDNRFLRGDGGNLGSFLRMLRDAHAGHYSQIRDAVRLAFPRFDDFVLEPSRLNPKRILLQWRERGSDYDFGPHQLSDGTLRFICLAALLLQPLDDPNAPFVITLDEPELGLHPYAVSLLASMLESASKHAQLVVSTQSAALLSAVDDPTCALVVDRSSEGSTFRRLDDVQIEPWLDDYSLGDVWEKGVIGGGPHS